MHADVLEDLSKKLEVSMKDSGLPFDPVTPRQPPSISSLPSLSISLSQQSSVRQGPSAIDSAPSLESELEELQKIATTKLSLNPGALERSLLSVAQELMVRLLKAKGTAEIPAVPSPPPPAPSPPPLPVGPLEAKCENSANDGLTPGVATGEDSGRTRGPPRVSEASTDSEEEERNIVNLSRLKELPWGGQGWRAFDEESECGQSIISSASLPRFQRQRTPQQ